MGKRRRWGSGTICRRRSDGRWIAAVRDGNKRRTRYASTEARAKLLLVELRREVAAGEPAINRRATVGQALLRWLAERRVAVGPSSYVRYEELIRLQLAGLAAKPLGTLTPDDVRRHVRTLSEAGVASATVAQTLRILRSAIALAEADGVVPRNVARGVSPPKRPPRIGQALTPPQVAALRSVAREDPLYALWALLLGTGLRMGEALGLRWGDIDLSAGVIRVTGSLRHQSRLTRGDGLRLQRVEPKTAAGRRSVPLPAFVAAALAARPTDAIYVFHRGQGEPLNPSTVQRHFRALLQSAGLPRIRLHDLRHTAATMAIRSGASLDDVKRMLGHSSISITSDIYGHVVEERQKEIAAGLDRAIDW